MKVRTRRTVAGILIVIGALLLLFATENTASGIALIIAGVVVEFVGIALERR